MIRGIFGYHIVIKDAVKKPSFVLKAMVYETPGEHLRRVKGQTAVEKNGVSASIYDLLYSKNNDPDSYSIYDMQYPTNETAPVWKKLHLLRKQKIRELLQPFMGFDHRLEPYLKIKGVQYIEDSKATNRNSLRFALEVMNKPIVLIMGGQNKDKDFPPPQIYGLIEEKVKAIVALGKDNTWVGDTFSKYINCYDTHSMEDAVSCANDIAQPGDVVLLSPAAASFDLFKNYEDRGDQFKETVKNL